MNRKPKLHGVEYLQLPNSAMDDLEALFDREAAVRIEIEDAFFGP